MSFIHPYQIFKNAILGFKKKRLGDGTLSKFPDLQKTDRILIFSPHIDDEVVGCGGLIQLAAEIGAKIKLVYATNGDASLLMNWKLNKRVSSSDFITIAERRVLEGKAAAKILGLNQDDLIFLGYPTSGLGQLFEGSYTEKNPFVSKTTKFSFNPYKDTFRKGQLYTRGNLLEDIKEIISAFSPTIIVGPHPKDNHTDHKALSFFIENILSGRKTKTKYYTYIIHFPHWPIEIGLNINSFLYPPKDVFDSASWYSLDLLPKQKKLKLKALRKNVTQLKDTGMINFLESFVKRNEIFERVNYFDRNRR